MSISVLQSDSSNMEEIMRIKRCTFSFSRDPWQRLRDDGGLIKLELQPRKGGNKFRRMGRKVIQSTGDGLYQEEALLTDKEFLRFLNLFEGLPEFLGTTCEKTQVVVVAPPEQVYAGGLGMRTRYITKTHLSIAGSGLNQDMYPEQIVETFFGGNT